MWAVWIEGFPSVSVQLARFESLAMSSSGGIIGGVIAFVVIAKILGVDLPRLSDAAVPAALLGFAIGRVGCLLNGDDYGRALPAGRGLLHEWLSWATGGGVPRYPVQLVETFFCLGAYIMLVLLRPIPSGRIAALGALLYSLMRLATEILRGDWRGPTLAIMFDLKLSPPQFIALVGFSISLGFLALGKKKLPKGSQT
jgi:phosphatidylglycerol:prolipoprotein diacylglycerol transferase